jgi:hypothetical protein
LIAQLNVWAPQLELQVQQVLGAAMVAEGRTQQLAEGGAAELTNIVVALRNELDARTATRLVSDENLKEELRAIFPACTRSSSRWRTPWSACDRPPHRQQPQQPHHRRLRHYRVQRRRR